MENIINNPIIILGIGLLIGGIIIPLGAWFDGIMFNKKLKRMKEENLDIEFQSFFWEFLVLCIWEMSFVLLAFMAGYLIGNAG